MPAHDCMIIQIKYTHLLCGEIHSQMMQLYTKHIVNFLFQASLYYSPLIKQKAFLGLIIKTAANIFLNHFHSEFN